MKDSCHESLHFEGFWGHLGILLRDLGGVRTRFWIDFRWSRLDFGLILEGFDRKNPVKVKKRLKKASTYLKMRKNAESFLGLDLKGFWEELAFSEGFGKAVGGIWLDFGRVGVACYRRLPRW